MKHIASKIGAEIEEQMRKDLITYESSLGIIVNYKQFALVLTEEKDSIISIW